MLTDTYIDCVSTKNTFMQQVLFMQQEYALTRVFHKENKQ